MQKNISEYLDIIQNDVLGVNLGIGEIKNGVPIQVMLAKSVSSFEDFER